MAIKYLDLISGNDANDGLSAITPKKTLTAATALIATTADEIRVRGTDTLYATISGGTSWTWTNGSNNVTNSTGDFRTKVAAGDYICKKTSGLPQLYLVASTSYSAPTTTVVLTNTTNCTYRGTTETVATDKLVKTAVIALQTLGRDGQTSGTAASWTRVDTKISGGWNAAYTGQTSYTLIYNTANAGTASVLNNEATARNYWDIQKMIILNGNQYFCMQNTYGHYSDCAFIGVSTQRNVLATSTWMVYSNCYFYHSATAYDCMIANTNNSFTNCSWVNTINRNTLVAATSGQFNNCTVNQGNLSVFNGVTSQSFSGTTFNFNGATFCAGTNNTNTFKSCTWNVGTCTTNLSTANTVENCTFNATTSNALTIAGTFTANKPNTFSCGSGAVALTTTAPMSGNTITTTGAITLLSNSTVKSLTINGASGGRTIGNASNILTTLDNCTIASTTGSISIYSVGSMNTCSFTSTANVTGAITFAGYPIIRNTTIATTVGGWTITGDLGTAGTNSFPRTSPCNNSCTLTTYDNLNNINFGGNDTNYYGGLLTTFNVYGETFTNVTMNGIYICVVNGGNLNMSGTSLGCTYNTVTTITCQSRLHHLNWKQSAYSGATQASDWFRISSPIIEDCRINSDRGLPIQITESTTVRNNVFTGTTYGLSVASTAINCQFVGNTVAGNAAVSCSIGSNVIGQNWIISGNTGSKLTLGTIRGIMVNNTGFKGASVFYAPTMIIDKTTEFNRTSYTRSAIIPTGIYAYKPEWQSYLIQPTGNTIFFNAGYVEKTTDKYSGTTALKFTNTYQHTDSAFRAVDFNVTGGATGSLKFFIKASKSCNVFYNVWDGNGFIWNNFRAVAATTSWQEVRYNIQASDFASSGTATLWFRINDTAATWFNVDSIGIYSGSTTNTTNYTGSTYSANPTYVNYYTSGIIPTSGLTHKWEFKNNTLDSVGLVQPTVAGTPVYSAGKVGACVSVASGQFDLHCYNTGFNAFRGEFSGTTNYSICQWIYFGTSNTAYISLGWNTGSLSQLDIGVTGTYINYYTRTGALKNNVITGIAVGWHHVIMRFNGSKTDILLDGVQRYTWTENTSITLANIDLQLAYVYSISKESQLLIYNRAISDSEALGIYNNSIGTNNYV